MLHQVPCNSHVEYMCQIRNLISSRGVWEKCCSIAFCSFMAATGKSCCGVLRRLEYVLTYVSIVYYVIEVLVRRWQVYGPRGSTGLTPAQLQQRGSAVCLHLCSKLFARTRKRP